MYAYHHYLETERKIGGGDFCHGNIQLKRRVFSYRIIKIVELSLRKSERNKKIDGKISKKCRRV